MEKKKSKIQSVLLCWNIIPEDIEFYNIPRNILSKDHMKMFRACHNKIINCDITPSEEFTEDEIQYHLSMLSDSIADLSKGFFDDEYVKTRSDELGISTSEFKQLLGVFHKYKINNDKPKNFRAIKLIVSGFLL